MILRLRKLIGANGPLSLKTSKSLKTSDLRANSNFYDQFRHEGIQSEKLEQLEKCKKIFSAFFEPWGPLRGTAYLGFQIEIPKMP